MSDTKIQIKVGVVEFSGEGNQEWLSSQLDKVLAKMPELLKIRVTASDSSHDPQVGKLGETKGATTKNLALFLKEKSATTVQTKKFLATAAFLQLKGNTRTTTADVSKALKDSNQTKLNNPSDCLNQNVSRGFCEKDGEKGFFVTDTGMSELG
jgi:hypothetical protein